MTTIDTQAISVPDAVLQGWQQTVNLIAEIVAIPAALIMRVHSDEIEVLSRSSNADNPYHPHEKAELGHGLYCETVIRERGELLIPNALHNPAWQHNPDIKLGMIAYCGLPLCWPDATPFGTICMLDYQENHYSARSRQLLERFQKAVEADLLTLYQHTELIHANLQLERRIQARTQELEQLNQKLIQEIDSRATVQRNLEYSQHYDSLTGLANRFSLLERLSQLLSRPPADQPEIAVIYLGLCNFKSINNSYGYLMGDKVLIEVSQRIRQTVGSEHYVARGSGDEFIVLMSAPAETAAPQSLEVMHRLAQCFNAAIPLEGHAITVQMNAGIALAPTDSHEAKALLQKAGAAMSACKELGSQHSFFGPATQSAMDERYLIESHLVDALNNNELSLHYQPLICTQTRKILGAEALLRWHNPVLGNIAPDRFISLAELNGQIIEIGHFVLHTAIAQASRWQQYCADGFRIAINISPVQFRDEQLAEEIAQLLAHYQLPAEQLELEVTEGVLLQDEYRAGRIIQGLQKLGARISLDDFGTGYASLSYLQKYAFDTLKIDRSFIAHLEDRQQDQELARAIIAMAKKLQLHVIAEGVETLAQDAFILGEGCDYGQGYLYGKPVPAEVFAAQYLL